MICIFHKKRKNAGPPLLSGDHKVIEYGFTLLNNQCPLESDVEGQLNWTFCEKMGDLENMMLTFPVAVFFYVTLNSSTSA